MQSNDHGIPGQAPEQVLSALPERISSPLFVHADHNPHAPALSDHSGQRLSYGELAHTVREMESCLREAGAAAGDRVMLIAENCVGLGVLILAASELGAWPVIVNARMALPELDRIRMHARPRLVIYTRDSAAAERHFAACRSERNGQEMQWAGVRLGVETDQAVEAEHDPARGNDAIFTLIYTTGTTGDPKGVMLSHRNVLYVSAVTSALRGLQASDRVYLVLPVSHVFGLAAVFLACLYVGAELVMADRFDADVALETLAERKITGLFGVPTMFAHLSDRIRSKGMPAGGLPHLRFMYSGGAPLEPGLKADVEQRFGLPLLNAYGMTESAPTICQVRYNEPLDSCSVGRPLPGLDVRVTGADGKPVAVGEVGELHIRGPNIMRAYYRNPDATAAAIDAEGYLNTGDLVRLDPDGNVFIAGRSKELIIHSGFNVYPPEVEAAISAHPDVLFCAVVGEQRDGNEHVVAYVQPVPGSKLSEAALIDYVRPALTAYKRPSRIEFRDELPTAASGKVLKHKLR